MITCMARQILNDRSVHITVFNLENDMIQAIFQSYMLKDPDNHYDYQVIEVNSAQAIKKNLNLKHNT